MSDAAHDDADSHQSFIRTPKQLIAVIVAAFVVPVVVIVMITHYIASESKTGAGSDAMSPEAIARRLQPVGTIEIRDASQAAAPKTGEQIYQTVCSACHATGAAGAPKMGDNAAWAPRIAQGWETLVKTATAGKGAMPPRGGAADLSDFELERAIVYMTDKSGASFPEPKAPAAAASAPLAAASAAK